jgi:hypothetical protein
MARSNDDMLYEIEHANEGRGPVPLASYHGTALREIMDLMDERADVEARIAQAVDRARSEGATWPMIRLALAVSPPTSSRRLRPITSEAGASSEAMAPAMWPTRTEMPGAPPQSECKPGDAPSDTPPRRTS